MLYIVNIQLFTCFYGISEKIYMLSPPKNVVAKCPLSKKGGGVVTKNLPNTRNLQSECIEVRPA